MAELVLMPKVGISVESCIITGWEKQLGDTIAVGDPLFAYETDKATFACESTAAGILLKKFYDNGDEVPVLTPVCAIGTAGEDVASLGPASAQKTAPVPSGVSATADNAASFAPQMAATTAAVNPSKEACFAMAAPGNVEKISPRAKRLAEKHNVNTRLVSANGPYGRMMAADVQKAIDSGIGVMTAAACHTGVPCTSVGSGVGGRITLADVTAPAATASFIPALTGDYKDTLLSGPRRTISKRMALSLAEIPQLTHNFSFDASEMLAYRAKLKQNASSLGLPNITLTDFILFVTSRLLLKTPQLNAHMVDAATLRCFQEVHLNIAVDTPNGLLVPVLRNANRKNLAALAKEAKELARKAQEGVLGPDDMAGGTFTVSNLGAFGVESFTPIINPPQTGILGVNNIIRRPKEENGQIKLYPAMGLSLTYDHRAIDGAPASRFGSELCTMLEHFTATLRQLAPEMDAFI